LNETIKGRSNKLLPPAGINVPLIVNLSVPQVSPGGRIATFGGSKGLPLTQLMRFLPFILGLVCAAAIGCSSASVPLTTLAFSGSDEALARAFKQRANNVQVEGRGIVRRVLSDGDDGSRHQRFIVALASGQTLLIAHNIDLAPRVVGLGKGDVVSFSGEYQWNPEGGVIHWTHRDPGNRHPSGWIKHKGKIYQ
jgi:hypothetical protein